MNATDFIGKSGVIARACFGKVQRLKTEALEPIDRAWLFIGPAGVGKTSLAMSLAAEVAGHKLAIEQVNGQSMTVDVVRHWQEEGWYHPLYGNRWVKVIDEIDAASPAACNEARSWLDQLAPQVVVLATTNKSISELQEQLQSRFKTYRFDPIPVPILAPWLVAKFNLSPDMAMQTAIQSKGNVRAAKADALSQLECLETV